MQQPHESLASLDSARLLPCARRDSRQVVEGAHRIMAERIGREPYRPCQYRIPGDGGLKDIESGVVLAVHSPPARPALEYLAHPLSALFARHAPRAGLTRISRVDLDDGHACGERLVFDLTVKFAARPRREAPVHPPGSPARTVKREVFEDDGRLSPCGLLDEALTDEVKALLHAVPLAASLAGEEVTHHSAVVRLLLREASPSAEVRRLYPTDAPERDRDECGLVAYRGYAIERVLISIEGDGTFRLIWRRRISAYCDYDLIRCDSKRAEAPYRIREDGMVPARDWQIKFDVFAPTNRDAQPSNDAIESIGLVFGLKDKSPEIWNTVLSAEPYAPPVVLEAGHRDLEGRGNMLLVDVVFGGEPTIDDLREPEPGADILPQCGLDRLVDDEPELFHQEEQFGRDFDGEDQTSDNLLHDALEMNVKV